jgi:hypothetical protein
MKTLLTIFGSFLMLLLYGQRKADKELTRFLKTHKLDTFIYVKAGCTECTISYEDTTKPTDVATIWLLYRYMGNQSMAVFSDTTQIKQYKQIKTDIFSFIHLKEQILKKKSIYYKEQQNLKFKAPCLATFPYETVGSPFLVRVTSRQIH